MTGVEKLNELLLNPAPQTRPVVSALLYAGKIAEELAQTASDIETHLMYPHRVKTKVYAGHPSMDVLAQCAAEEVAYLKQLLEDLEAALK